jgi:nucleoside-diphosphate-sugar epimerase
MILLTGATGYLGSRLIPDLLTRNMKIRAIKRDHSILPESLIPYSTDLDWVNIDLGDIIALGEAMKGVDQVIHCATAREEGIQHSSEILRTNMDGTANLVNLSLDYKVSKFIFISSSITLGGKESGREEPVSLLNDYNNALDPYIFSKIEAEKEVWRGIMEGLPAIILNPGLILSGWDEGFPNPHLKNLYESGSEYYFQQDFGFIWIQDLIQMIIDALQSERLGKQYLISSENISGLHLIQKINEKLGIKSPNKNFRKGSWKIPGWGESLSDRKLKSGIRELARMVKGMIALKTHPCNPLTGNAYRNLNELF